MHSVMKVTKLAIHSFQHFLVWRIFLLTGIASLIPPVTAVAQKLLCFETRSKQKILLINQKLLINFEFAMAKRCFFNFYTTFYYINIILCHNNEEL